MNSPEPQPEPAETFQARKPLLRDPRWRTGLLGGLMALLILALGSFVVLMSQHVAQEQAQETLERALLRQAQDIQHVTAEPCTKDLTRSGDTRHACAWACTSA